jgi:hypothetical protein
MICVLALVGLNSCKKSTEYIPVPYACGCGGVKWRGSSFDLLDANYILADSTVALSRKYYVTADVREEGEELTHSVSMLLEIPNVEDGVFYVDDSNSDFTADVDERDDNQMILSRRRYKAIEGIIQVNPAIFGGIEKVVFTLVLKELDEDGNLVGSELNFSGSFRLDIDVY